MQQGAIRQHRQQHSSELLLFLGRLHGAHEPVAGRGIFRFLHPWLARQPELYPREHAPGRELAAAWHAGRIELFEQYSGRIVFFHPGQQVGPREEQKP